MYLQQFMFFNLFICFINKKRLLEFYNNLNILFVLNIVLIFNFILFLIVKYQIYLFLMNHMNLLKTYYVKKNNYSFMLIFINTKKELIKLVKLNCMRLL